MSEKFRKIAKSPVKAFNAARRNIKKMKPSSVGGKIAKGTGITLAGLFQFLSWTLKYTILDNQILRKFEKEFSDIIPGKNKKGDDKKFASFLQKYPSLSSHIVYYMLTASVIAGGKIASDAGLFNFTEQTIDIPDSEIGTYENFLAQYKTITPYLIGYLVNPEGYRSRPYKDSRGIWTQGHGSTQRKDGPVGPNSSPMSILDAYETARWHLEDYETYFILYCYCAAFDKRMNSNEFLGLASFIYNGGPEMFEPEKPENIKDKDQAKENRKDNHIRNDRWWELRQMYRTKGTISRDQVKELFEKYPVKSKGSVFQAWLDGNGGREIGNQMINYLRSGRVRAEGLVWRRWLEACLTAGVIDPMDIMNCPIGGVYEFRQYMKAHGKELIVGNQMNYVAGAEFKQWVKDPQYWDRRHKKFMRPENIQLTKSVMPVKIINKCKSGVCDIASLDQITILDSGTIANQKSSIVKSNLFVEIATKYLYDKNYAMAEKNYTKAIESNPDNSLAYSDLSYLYLKWGKYDKGVSVVQDMIVHKSTMNDFFGMAGAYYNAGLCHRKMAESGINSSENYRMARANMDNAKKLQPKVDAYQKQIDEISAALRKLMDKKKLSFNDGGQKINTIDAVKGNVNQTYEIIQKSGRA